MPSACPGEMGATRLHLRKVGPQISVPPPTWTVMDLGLPGQRELLLSKVRATVAPVLCLLETPEELQPWCLHGELMAPCRHALLPETGACLESSLSKASYKDSSVSHFKSLLS